MNYLAHLFLAKDHSCSLVGNLMGDFLKGVNIDQLPTGIQLGIRNHKLVDHFTDSHQEISRLKKVISEERKRYAGIITDVVFDFFLIQHWGCFTGVEFDRFVNRVYEKLMENLDLMPQKMATMVIRMVDMDWFRSYARFETMGYVLDRISNRIRFENKLSGAIEEVENNYDLFETVFLSYFPQLMEHVENLKIEGSAGTYVFTGKNDLSNNEVEFQNANLTPISIP